MTNQYYPRLGSVPDRAMKFMRAEGRGLSGGEISRLTGYGRKNIGNIMQATVTHGLVRKMRAGKSVYWCLPEHAGQPFSPDVCGSTPAGDDVATDDAVDAADAGDAPLEIAVWHDGDVIVKGGTPVQAHNGGTSISYNRAQAEQLARMLTQPPVRIAAP